MRIIKTLQSLIFQWLQGFSNLYVAKLRGERVLSSTYHPL